MALVVHGPWDSLLPWRRTFVASTAMPRDGLSVESVGALHDRLRRELAEAGAVPIDGVTLVSDGNADFFIRREVAVLAEVRALVLRHPNPFPRLRLFRWLPA